MSRSIRRHHKQRMKDKFIRKEKIKEYWGLVGHNPNLYANCKKRCSCWMCGNPRKYSKDKLTKQEKMAWLRVKDEI